MKTPNENARMLTNASEQVAEKAKDAIIAAVEGHPDLVADHHKVATALTATALLYASTLAMVVESMGEGERRLAVGQFKSLIAPELEKLINGGE